MTASGETTTESRAMTSEGSLLVCLGNAYADASAEQTAGVRQLMLHVLEQTRSNLGAVIIAAPTTQHESQVTEQDGMTLLTYPATGADAITAHTAANWLAFAGLMRVHHATVGLLLGAEAQSLMPEAVAGMIDAVAEHGVDLALPHYVLPANQGLLNQAMLAPLSRALFSAKVGFPLALDAAFSVRMAQRMEQAAQRTAAALQAETLVWPVNEAAVAGFDVAEVGETGRELPPVHDDLSQILRDVAGSLFGDIEAKATYWQRSRPAKETLRLAVVEASVPPNVEHAGDEEIEDLLASFRIGYNNLHDIWSLVLPPQTLVNLKRLSQAPRENFVLTDAVWVRIVYDFVLAHRLRTLSRSHLLGALTPLYLAWVASHLVGLRNGTASGADQLGRLFETDRPYLVARWRWPDRFNP